MFYIKRRFQTDLRGILVNKHITVDPFNNVVESLFQRNENVIHPSERDYGMIASYEQKYCASIFYRGWYLKYQTLYSHHSLYVYS